MKKQILLSLLSGVLVVVADDSALSQHVLSMLDYTSGVAVLPRVDADGGLAVALATNSEFIVYAQHTDDGVVQTAKMLADSNGLLNRKVYVSEGTADQIQMANDYADLLLMTDLTNAELTGSLLAEVRRMATPNGLVVLGAEGGTGLTEAALTNWLSVGGVQSYSVTNDSFGLWATFSEPRDPEEDDWAYWYHNPDGNPVSEDTALKFPYLSQFYSAPFHGAKPNCTVIAEGRVFRSMGMVNSIRDTWEAQPDYCTISAHNGYNGQTLWRHVRPPSPTEKFAYTATKDTYYLLETNRVLMLDAATGVEKESIVFTSGYVHPKWMAIHSNTVIVMKGDPDNPAPVPGTSKYEYQRWDNVESPWGKGRELAAYDLTTHTQVWSHMEPSIMESRNIVMSDGRIYFNAPSTNFNAVSENMIGRVGCLNADTGALLWENTNETVIAAINQIHQGLWGELSRARHGMMVYSNRLTIWRAGSTNLVALSTEDGSFAWKHPIKTTMLHVAPHWQLETRPRKSPLCPLVFDPVV